jgi:hypothetical protein
MEAAQGLAFFQCIIQKNLQHAMQTLAEYNLSTQRDRTLFSNIFFDPYLQNFN